MKIFYNKSRYSIVLMVILALVLQIAGPIVSEYAYASEDIDQELDLEKEKEMLSEDDGSDETDPEDFKGNGETDKSKEEETKTEKDSQIKKDDDLSKPEDGEKNTKEEPKQKNEKEESKEEPKKENEKETKVDEEEPESKNSKLENKKISTFSGDPVTWNDVEIEHVDSSGNPLTGPFQIDSDVKIGFSYTIVDAEEVDTDKIYNFTIPEEIKIIKNLDLELKDGSRVLANISVKTDGSMTVKFLPEINNPDFDEERSGWINIRSQFDETKLGDGGDKTIKFEYDGKSKDIVVEFEEIVVEENIILEKNGSYNTSNNEITWTVRVKPKIGRAHV